MKMNARELLQFLPSYIIRQNLSLFISPLQINAPSKTCAEHYCGQGVAGVSDRMRSACGTVFACKRICALQGRRGRGLHFHYEEQRRQRAGKMCNRTCSALTQWVTLIEGKKINVHKASQAKVSGQLPFLGSTIRFAENANPNITYPQSRFFTYIFL